MCNVSLPSYTSTNPPVSMFTPHTNFITCHLRPSSTWNRAWQSMEPDSEALEQGIQGTLGQWQWLQWPQIQEQRPGKSSPKQSSAILAVPSMDSTDHWPLSSHATLSRKEPLVSTSWQAIHVGTSYIDIYVYIIYSFIGITNENQCGMFDWFFGWTCNCS